MPKKVKDDFTLANPEKGISLEELIQLTLKYNDGLVTKEQMGEYGASMIIRGYLPLVKKMSLASFLSANKMFDTTNSFELKMGRLYKDLFFYVMLQEYAFVDCSNVELQTYENYDLLYPIFAPFILSYCSEDYAQFKEILHDVMNMYNIKDLAEAAEGLDVVALKKDAQSNRELINTIENNLPLLTTLKDAALLNDPGLSEIIEDIKKSAQKDAMSKKS